MHSGSGLFTLYALGVVPAQMSGPCDSAVECHESAMTMQAMYALLEGFSGQPVSSAIAARSVTLCVLTSGATNVGRKGSGSQALQRVTTAV